MSWWHRFTGREPDRGPRTWHGKDFYGVLGVSPAAGADEIRRAARTLLRMYLPDNPAAPPDAEQRYRAVSEACEVLRDPASRREYDDTRRHVVPNGDAEASRAAESEQVAKDMTKGEEVTRDGPT